MHVVSYVTHAVPSTLSTNTEFTYTHLVMLKCEGRLLEPHFLWEEDSSGDLFTLPPLGAFLLTAGAEQSLLWCLLVAQFQLLSVGTLQGRLCIFRSICDAPCCSN